MAFSISELNHLNDKPVKKDSDILCDRFLSVHDARVKSLKELSGRLPDKNQIYFIWTLNSFNAFTFIPYIFKYSGCIDQLYVSTYSINQRIVDAFMRFLTTGKILKADLFISESIQNRSPHVCDYLSHCASSNPGRLNVTYAWNHSKVTLAKSNGNYYCVEGSGNWSENSRHEQYIFLNSPEVYKFRSNWITNELPGTL